jgi:hypothetical protein
MTILCKKFFPNELAALQNGLINSGLRSNPDLSRAVTYSETSETGEEEDSTQRDESEDEDDDTKASNPYGLDIDDRWENGVTLVDDGRRRPRAGNAAAR